MLNQLNLTRTDYGYSDAPFTSEVKTAPQMNEAYFRSLLDHATAALLVLDLDGRIIDCNSRTSVLLGYPHEELLRMNLAEVGVSPSLAQLFKIWTEMVQGEAWQTEGTCLRQDGSRLPVDLSLKRFCDGGFSKILLSIQDVTTHRQAIRENEQLQQQLLRMQKFELLGSLVAGVAHDFNNMLTVIMGQVQIDLHRLSPGDPKCTRLRSIHEAAEHSADLARQLLGFSRQSDGREEVVNVNDAIKGMFRLLQLVGEQNTLDYNPTPQASMTRIDPIQLKQILVNLVANARDAMAAPGSITITTENLHYDGCQCSKDRGRAPGDYVVISVSDTGQGMSQAVVDSIYEPFFTTKEKGRGTGLGLTLIDNIVRQKHGFIEVHSALGEGTTFRIHLPQLTKKR